MKFNEITIDALILGGGVLGLSTARAFLKKFPNTSLVVIDRHHKFGQETSSRNSEVIHAGFYYAPDSLKAKHCIIGKTLLYEYLRKKNIPFNNCGKYILSFDENDESKIQAYLQQAKSADIPLQQVDSGQLFSKLQIKNIKSGLWSSSTGILDSHSFMLSLESEVLDLGGNILYSTQFLQTDDQTPHKLIIQQGDSNNSTFYKVDSSITINCTGLNCTNIYKDMNGSKDFNIVPCLGHYYTLSNKFSGRFKNLIYPIPKSDGGLGIHLTLDLSGALRLGPDVEWTEKTKYVDDKSTYNFNDSAEKREMFFKQCQRYIPEVKPHDLEPGYIGIRPKLFLNGSKMEDFFIEENTYSNKKTIHALGIESPGLTAALSLAEEIVNRI